jgi:hypothetical protein
VTRWLVAVLGAALWTAAAGTAQAQEPDPCTGGYVALCLSPSLTPSIHLLPILEGGAIQLGPIEKVCVLPGSCPDQA